MGIAIHQDFRGNPTLFEDNDIGIVGFAGGIFETAVGTTFIAVAEGELMAGNYCLHSGMYACVPATAPICGRDGCCALLATTKHYTGIFMLGGPIEPIGRLRYISGCTDTGLLQPLRLGDPCLNHLHFPGGTKQAPHYHPSHRIGLIHSGEGLCHTPAGPKPMRPGNIFVLPAGTVHWFTTQNHPMQIVVFHPDSEFGPTDEDHQMLNATLSNAK